MLWTEWPAYIIFLLLQVVRTRCTGKHTKIIWKANNHVYMFTVHFLAEILPLTEIAQVLPILLRPPASL